MAGFRLLDPQRRTLDALCRRIVPAAYTPADGAPMDVAAAVERRLADGDPAVARQVATLLRVFDHRVAALVLCGRPACFSRLAADRQDAMLREWERSRLPLKRTIFQAFRRLVLSTYYADADATAALGARPPLHERAPEVAWEGPAPGEPTDAEPVLRTAEPWRPPTPARRPIPTGVTLGRDLADGTVVRAEICVVGTGAGGAVAAARLAELGHDVVLLEEGSWWDPADFSERESEMVPRLYADGGTRATADLSVSILQGRAVGGSALVNWLIMLRTPDWVLDEWQREHAAEGMSATEMGDVFDLIEAETHARCVPPDAHSPINQALLDGALRLGWRARGAKVNAMGCVRAGTCGLGCRYDAKRGPAAVYVPRALAAGARLYADVRADRMEIIGRGTTPTKRVHATVLDPALGTPRGRCTVEAPVVILAGGAVGTPALLLRSGLDGPATGRYLRLHPTSAVLGQFDREMSQSAGLPLTTLCDEFLHGDDGYGFWIETPPLYPAIASAVLPGFGSAHRDWMTRFRQLGAMIVLVRDGADRTESNGDVRIDRHGRPVIRYRLGDRDRRTMLRGVAETARLQLATGAREVRTLHADGPVLRGEADLARLAGLRSGPNELALLSAHVNGTCRLGGDPRTSTCSPDGAVRGAAGVYVLDGSVLPTALGVNPQETIMAVATVLARRLHERHA